MDKKIRVTIWNEYTHEKHMPEVAALYPEGIHGHIKKTLAFDGDLEITLAALDDPNQGLSDELLNNTDVLLWWGHMRHGEVDDGLVERIRERVYRCGMGFIGLHSAHHSKPFRAIIGCTGDLLWGDEQKEIVWNVNPGHPIAAGIPEHFVFESEEMYGEPFYIAPPDEVVFASWFEHGNIFRSGCCWRRGMGRIFYFQPGHETCPSFYNEHVIRIIDNAIHWAAPCEIGVETPEQCRYFEKLHVNN
ncbi:MAG: ThuA domain-containing protein [Clostridia bacterium]|nr:ThuA domain-containing protein [Clostridia bacterium]